MIDLSRLSSPKSFERLTADLLEAEGFRIISEPGIDVSGMDLLADETFASHSGATRVVSWCIQCKHYATSGRNLGRAEIEAILACFQLRPEDGLLIVCSTDISETGLGVLGSFSRDRGKGRFVRVWNRRELENRLLQQPALLAKYELSDPPQQGAGAFPLASGLATKRVLVLSDNSAFAYQLVTRLQPYCGNLHVITSSQYEGDRVEWLFSDMLRERHDAAIVFLGDSFRLPLPAALQQKLNRIVAEGGGLVLLPFLAWAADYGKIPFLESVLPVTMLTDAARKRGWPDMTRLLLDGDLGELNTDSFAENRYVTAIPNGYHPILAGLPTRVELIHSYEFLECKPWATPIMLDSSGNPLLVVSNDDRARIAYVNSCMHNCLTRSPLLSPYETSREFAHVFENTILWTLQLATIANARSAS